MVSIQILAVIAPFVSVLVAYAFCEWAKCTPKCISLCYCLSSPMTHSSPATPVSIAHSVPSQAIPAHSVYMPWACTPGVVSTWPHPSTSPIGHAVFHIQLYSHWRGLSWIGIHEISHTCIDHAISQGGTRIVFDGDQVTIHCADQVVTSFLLDAHFFNDEVHLCRVMLSARCLQIDLYPQNPRSTPQILACLLPESVRALPDGADHRQRCVHVYSDTLSGYPITQFSFRNILLEESMDPHVVVPIPSNPFPLQ